MATSTIGGSRIAAMCTCVPSKRFNNLTESSEFTQDEVRKVVAMAGIHERRLADETICSSDLCVAAATRVINSLNWSLDSIDALIMVTQSPDYLLPSTACVIQDRLKLSKNCAAFDVGLGCSGYPYGLWLASMMLKCGGLRRVLLLHGETPGRFSDSSDRAVALLFGDAGSATAIEAADSMTVDDWHFVLRTDGSGYKDMIIEAGGFRHRFDDDPQKHCVSMNGANIFNFTIKCVPPLIRDTLHHSGIDKDDIDYFIFHQSNQFIMKHLMKKLEIEKEKLPITLTHFGNSGGPSVPLTITQGNLSRPVDRPLNMMLVGYGVVLSLGSALIELYPDAILEHVEL